VPQSLSNVLVHIVFSTKGRTPYLDEALRPELYKYIAGILRNLNSNLVQIGGVEDHIHILLTQPKTLSMAQLVEKLKTSSSKWIKAEFPKMRAFAWQSGYAAFSVSFEAAPAVKRYIQTQREHHQKRSFEDEFRELMALAGIEFDERYVWE
jgi:putative transposase